MGLATAPYRRRGVHSKHTDLRQNCNLRSRHVSTSRALGGPIVRTLAGGLTRPIAPVLIKPERFGWAAHPRAATLRRNPAGVLLGGSCADLSCNRAEGYDHNDGDAEIEHDRRNRNEQSENNRD